MAKFEKDRVYDVKIDKNLLPKHTIQKRFLTRTELDTLVIQPYSQGMSFVIDGNVIRPEEISSVTILERNTFTFGKINFVDRSGSDVTPKLIVGPPGHLNSQGDPSPKTHSELSQLFDQLITNEQLSEVSRARFATGHYADAVEASLKHLNNAVKEKSGATDKDGAELMRTVFSANCPILRINELQSQSDKDEQRGYMHLFEGAMIGIRNPRAHESGLIDDAATALEILAMVNHLMRKLETATYNSTNRKEIEDFSV